MSARTPEDVVRRRAALMRRSLHAADLADEVTAKRAENRIAAEIEEGPPREGVRAMLRGIRRRLFR